MLTKIDSCNEVSKKKFLLYRDINKFNRCIRQTQTSQDGNVKVLIKHSCIYNDITGIIFQAFCL